MCKRLGTGKRRRYEIQLDRHLMLIPLNPRRMSFCAVPAVLALLAIAMAQPLRAGESEISLAQDDYTVPAILAQPDNSIGPVPAVLMLHGFAGQKNEVGELFARLSKHLADQGIVSLRIDFAGAGDSTVGHELFTLSSAVRDAQTALTHLRNQPSVDPARIAVLGFSQGGLIAQQLVLQNPEIAALLTWSSVAADGVGSFQPYFDRYREKARDDGVALVDLDWRPQPLPLSNRWFEEIETQQTLTAMRDYKGPLLAIAGIADKIVPYQQSVALIAQSPHPESRVLLLAGADHLFNVLDVRVKDAGRPSHEQLLEETVSWLHARLSASHRSPATGE